MRVWLALFSIEATETPVSILFIGHWTNEHPPEALVADSLMFGLVFERKGMTTTEGEMTERIQEGHRS